MVYNPGGYKFIDYVVFGGPLQLWLLFITVGVTVTLDYWWIWWGVLIIGTCVLTPILAKQVSKTLIFRMCSGKKWIASKVSLNRALARPYRLTI